jgi:hypothetical protein
MSLYLAYTPLPQNPKPSKPSYNCHHNPSGLYSMSNEFHEQFGPPVPLNFNRYCWRVYIWHTRHYLKIQNRQYRHITVITIPVVYIVCIMSFMNNLDLQSLSISTVIDRESIFGIHATTSKSKTVNTVV